MKYTKTLLLALLSFSSLFACTVLTVTDGEQIYAASNKDWNNSATRLRCYAATAEKYGRLYFGYQIPEGFQNVEGINDQGLWYSGASLPGRGDIANHSNKPTVSGELCEKVLAECASVSEVVELYRQYFTPHWQGHTLWADSAGNSVIIEYADSDLVFLYPGDDYQLMTNFYLCDTLLRDWYDCYRFELAGSLLQNRSETGPAMIRKLLENVHQEGLYPTVSSNIYDLKSGEMEIHYFHRYTESICLNAYALMAAGDAYIALPELYNGIELLSPLDGDVTDPGTVTLEWNGDADAYKVFCSADKNFQDCEPFLYTAVKPAGPGIVGLALCVLLALAGWLRRRGKRAVMLILIGLAILAAGCDLGMVTSPLHPSKRHHTMQLTDLDSNTVCYWKVEVHHENGVCNRSTPQYFYNW